jgi:hypothetical protein
VGDAGTEVGWIEVVAVGVESWGWPPQAPAAKAASRVRATAIAMVIDPRVLID